MVCVCVRVCESVGVGVGVLDNLLCNGRTFSL